MIGDLFRSDHEFLATSGSSSFTLLSSRMNSSVKIVGAVFMGQFLKRII
jgi:hypothetical protein